MIKPKPFFVSLLLPVLVGFASASLIRGAPGIYEGLELPPFSPPSWIFGVVWPVLFVLMGIASYLVYDSDCLHRRTALTLYGLQLVVNFFWPLFFFRLRAPLLSALWLVLLLVSVAAVTVLFFRCRRSAGVLLLPYLLWLCYALYLNLGVVLLN